jgi:outer membrane lipoprotein-sorting protein
MLILKLLTLAALAAPADGAGWLAEIDRAAGRSDDAHVVLDVKVIDARGKEADRTLEIWQKGTEKRVVRLTAPARLAGIALLLDGDTVHLYLPAYERTTRVVGDQRGDAFMGTDFSIEDLSRITYGDEFTAAVESADAESATLLLTPLDPKAHDFHALRLHVRAADYLPTLLEHLDEEGAVTRRVTLSDFKEVSGRNMAHQMEVVDLERDRRNVASIREVAFDQGLDDELFTVTALERQ